MKHKVFLILIFINSLCYGLDRTDIGTATAQFLKLGPGAKPAAMGDSFTAVANDATAVYWNPAGLCDVKSTSVSLMHAAWFGNITNDWVSCACSAPAGTFGFGVQYLSYGSIEQTDYTGLSIGSFNPRDMAFTVSYSRNIAAVRFGISAKYISSTIENTATAFAADAGGIVKLYDDKLSLGIILQNAGTKMKFIDVENQLPTTLRFGLAYYAGKNLLVASDIDFPVDGEIGTGIGFEYRYLLSTGLALAGRAGYNSRAKDVNGLTGLTTGIGVELCSFGFDYAFVPFGDLGITQRISFSYKF